MDKSKLKQKFRTWWGVGYPENMFPDWKDTIADVLQLEGCYCLHDKDRGEAGEDRKEHVHLILTFPNTTTGNAAFNVFNKLSLPGREAFPLARFDSVVGIRSAYDYLIHDTEGCKKAGKHLYDPSERIILNGFDIGFLEQIGEAEKAEMLEELTRECLAHHFLNYSTLTEYVLKEKESKYLKILIGHSGHFARLCKGNYQQIELGELPGDPEPPEDAEN